MNHKGSMILGICTSITMLRFEYIIEVGVGREKCGRMVSFRSIDQMLNTSNTKPMKALCLLHSLRYSAEGNLPTRRR